MRLVFVADPTGWVFAAVLAYIRRHQRRGRPAPVHHAEEAVQATVLRFLELLRAWDLIALTPNADPCAVLDPTQFATLDDFDRYFLRAAINAFIDHARRRQAAALGAHDPAAEPDNWTAEMVRCLPAALATLAPTDRLLIRLRYDERWTLCELTTVHCPHTANQSTAICQVHAHLNDLTRQLRDHLDSHDWPDAPK
jgi:hypothetical protein